MKKLQLEKPRRFSPFKNTTLFFWIRREMESAECQTVCDGKFEFMGLHATDGGSWRNLNQEVM